MSQELTTTSTSGVSIFSTIETFEHWQRVAGMLSQSDIVPSSYQGKVANTMVAIELANRIGISPIMVMQNLDVIKGKPSWNSTFIIAAINSCGRFEPLRFEFSGTPQTDEYGCRAITTDTKGVELKGPKITWIMVKAEGWLAKAGSKWKTMPELMFQYRAASFFGRLYAPDILKGMHSIEEVQDFVKMDKGDFEAAQKKEETERAISFITKAKTMDELLMAVDGFDMSDNEDVRTAYDEQLGKLQNS